jgi:hypothetical protein
VCWSWRPLILQIVVWTGRDRTPGTGRQAKTTTSADASAPHASPSADRRGGLSCALLENLSDGTVAHDIHPDAARNTIDVVKDVRKHLNKKPRRRERTRTTPRM